MTFTTHCTFNINADGQVERREGQLPAVIKRSPVSVTVLDGTDHQLAALLLRRLAEGLEREGEPTMPTPPFHRSSRSH